MRANAQRFIASAVAALVEAAGKQYALALAPAIDGDPSAIRVLVTFARAVRLIRTDASDIEVHRALRRLLAELGALRDCVSSRSAAA